jgi:hypothetical protein
MQMPVVLDLSAARDGQRVGLMLIGAKARTPAINSTRMLQQFSFQIPWYWLVRVKTVGSGKSAGIWGVGSEALLHEAHEVIPVIERQVL